MSWGQIEATFSGPQWPEPDPEGWRVYVQRELPLDNSEEALHVNLLDAEGGPYVYVYGRSRGVADQVDSPAVLAWFVKHADGCHAADLVWEIDDGPRYRYVWEKGELRKLRGVLDL